LNQQNKEKIKEFFEQNDRFAKINEIEIDEIDEGYAKTSMIIKEEHLNGAGVGHGGAIFLLADYAFAVASNSYGTLSLGINASISFLNGAQKDKKLFAEAKEVDKNHKLANYTVTITDEDDKTIAIMQGMVYKKDKKII